MYTITELSDTDAQTVLNGLTALATNHETLSRRTNRTGHLHIVHRLDDLHDRIKDELETQGYDS